MLWSLFAAGWVIVLVRLPLVGKPYSRVTFRMPGPYRFVRHPLYFGFLLAFWMTPTMTLAHLVFAFATTAYILLAIQFEERDLVAEHGPAYEDYRRRVSMIVPLASSAEVSGSRGGRVPT
jgi:protein-S-isoprenylcysteine O-methyltransferase Ste14